MSTVFIVVFERKVPIGECRHSRIGGLSDNTHLCHSGESQNPVPPSSFPRRRESSPILFPQSSLRRRPDASPRRVESLFPISCHCEERSDEAISHQPHYPSSYHTLINSLVSITFKLPPLDDILISTILILGFSASHSLISPSNTEIWSNFLVSKPRRNIFTFICGLG